MSRMSDEPGFTRLDQASDEDLARIVAAARAEPADMVGRMLGLLLTLKESPTRGLPVNTFEHCLQTATRAYRDGADEELVVVALLHDIGDEIAMHNHGEFAAILLGPFISEANRWLLEFHAPFQGYYFWHAFGGDRNARNRYVGHRHYNHTRKFVDEWDMPSFDPDYDTLPLDFFEPMVLRLFSAEPERRDAVIC